MNNKFEDIITEAKTVVLPSEDKAVLRAAIERHMMANPVGVMNSEVARHGIRSGFTSMLLPRLRTFLNQRTNPMPALTIIAVVLLSGSVSYASQDSLPGDTLYPVKRVTEEVRTVMTLDAEADARLEAQFAVKRLQEAEKLESQGKLDAETEARLEAEFAENTNDFVERAKKAAKKDKEAVVHASAEFQGRLDAHLATAPRTLNRGIVRALEAIDLNLSVEGESEVNATSTNATTTDVRGASESNLKIQRIRTEAQATESENIKTDLNLPVTNLATTSDGRASSSSLEIDAEVSAEAEDDKKEAASDHEDDNDGNIVEDLLIETSGTVKLGL